MKIIEKIKIIMTIFSLMMLSYVVMVFISHFSVYNKSESYRVADSFKAMILQTDVPAQYFIYFGIHIFVVVLIALTINSISKKVKQ